MKASGAATSDDYAICIVRRGRRGLLKSQAQLPENRRFGKVQVSQSASRGDLPGAIQMGKPWRFGGVIAHFTHEEGVGRPCLKLKAAGSRSWRRPTLGRPTALLFFFFFPPL